MSATNSPKATYEMISEEVKSPDVKKPWWVAKDQHARECMAEFLGTFIMMLSGTAVVHQVVLSDRKNGDYLSINIGWGIAVLFGVHCSDGISGAHLNPSVTLAMAVYRGMPWWKVPGYVISQFLGAFLASFVVFVMYKPSLDRADPHRMTMWKNYATAPHPDIGNATAFYTEVVATAVLLIGILSIGDKHNRPVSPSQGPVRVMLLILMIGMCFGMNSGYALNPARDFGPRLFTCVAGWGSKVFTAYNYYFWIPIVAPLLGALVGGAIYKVFIENHHPKDDVVSNNVEHDDGSMI